MTDPLTITRPETDRDVRPAQPRANGVENLVATVAELGSRTARLLDGSGVEITSIKDARNNTTTIDHDPQGNPETITDAKLKVTTLTWLPGGLLETIEDPLHHVTTLGYDTLGNLDTITDPLLHLTDIDPDPAGNIVTVTDPKLHVTQYEHDDQNRLTKVIDAALGHTDYVYDLKGNLRFLTDARGKTTEFEYNARDLVKTITNPLGQSRTFTYDFARNLRFADDAKGQQPHEEADAGGRGAEQDPRSVPGDEELADLVRAAIPIRRHESTREARERGLATLAGAGVEQGFVAQAPAGRHRGESQGHVPMTFVARASGLHLTAVEPHECRRRVIPRDHGDEPVLLRRTVAVRGDRPAPRRPPVARDGHAHVVRVHATRHPREPMDDPRPIGERHQ